MTLNLWDSPSILSSEENEGKRFGLATSSQSLELVFVAPEVFLLMDRLTTHLAQLLQDMSRIYRNGIYNS